jgi:hypothetical protein
MYTHQFAVNRSVIHVLVWGWQKHELPEFNIKFRTKAQGTLTQVVSKFSGDVHIFIVAEDAVDEPTKKILSKGYYSKDDACYFVEGRAVMDDFGVNGHAQDDNAKNILVYGFEDRLSPEFVPIYRPTDSGTFKEVITTPGFNYTVAVALESRPYSEDIEDFHSLTPTTENGEKRLLVLDSKMREFLKPRALHVDGAMGFRYFILPPGIIRAILTSSGI